MRIAAALTALLFVLGGVHTSLASLCGHAMPCCKRRAAEVTTVKPARPDCCELKAAPAAPELAATAAARVEAADVPVALVDAVVLPAPREREIAPSPLARPPPEPLFARKMSRLL